jgi:predicted transcriptional regulator
MNEKQQEKLEWLRREIQKGIDDLKAGRFRDGAEVMEEFREKLINLKAEQDKRDETVREAKYE